MKTEKIEIWVEDNKLEKIKENMRLNLDPFEDIEYTDTKGHLDCNTKVTLEIEMPEREGTFTESEIDRFANKLVHWDGDTREWIDKLFNGDFKE